MANVPFLTADAGYPQFDDEDDSDGCGCDGGCGFPQDTIEQIARNMTIKIDQQMMEAIYNSPNPPTTNITVANSIGKSESNTPCSLSKTPRELRFPTETTWGPCPPFEGPIVGFSDSPERNKQRLELQAEIDRHKDYIKEHFPTAGFNKVDTRIPGKVTHQHDIPLTPEKSQADKDADAADFAHFLNLWNAGLGPIRTLPAKGWHNDLVRACDQSAKGMTIYVASESNLEPVREMAKRLKRPDLVFKVAPSSENIGEEKGG